MVKRKRSAENVGFLSAYFSPDRNEELNFEKYHGPKYMDTCSLNTNSAWSLFQLVNEDVINQIKKVLTKNPGCKQFVKCELTYYIPERIKK